MTRYRARSTIQRDIGVTRPRTAHYWTSSPELAGLALALARLKAGSRGLDPGRLSIIRREQLLPGTEIYGLVWLSRKPHPITGSFKRQHLLVDWATLELVD